MHLCSMSMVIIQKVNLMFFSIYIQSFDSATKDVARAMDIAFKYRNYFRKDIIVDLLVYRRW